MVNGVFPTTISMSRQIHSKWRNKEINRVFFPLLKEILLLFYQLICLIWYVRVRNIGFKYSTLVLGDLFPMVMSAQMRFGTANKQFSNTNVFEHSGKFYSTSEDHMPQEIDIQTLNTLENWDVNGSWNRPFTAHPKVKVCQDPNSTNNL